MQDGLRPELDGPSRRRIKRTCQSLDARALEEASGAVLIVPVGLGRQVPAVVDVVVLLLDLQAVEVCRRDGAHGVQAGGGTHIQPGERDTHTQRHPESAQTA